MKFRYDPPTILKILFNSYHWNTSNDKVLLTFDDGPTPEATPVILELLNRYSIKALFFCVGENLQRHPDLAESIVESGHIIGSHTFKHKNLRELSKSEIVRELEEFNGIYKNLFNALPLYFRPPYGRFTYNMQGTLESLGMRNVMWSLLTYDYQNDLNIVKFAVTNYLRSDSIIVLHDSKKNLDIIAEAIELIHSEVVDRKYEFGDPAECLK